MKKTNQNACRALLLILLALAASMPDSRAATRFWTGASATSGNWTTAANWQGGVAPSPGDILQFVDTGLRKASNTNNFAAGTRFSVINCFGNGYRLRGNRVVITNSLNVGNPAGSHIVDLDLTLGALDASVTLSAFDAAASLTINGDINLGSQRLMTDGLGDITIAGVISGTGSVYKNNGGELSFAGFGPNSYSGQTTVARGVLRLSRYLIVGGIMLPIGTTAIAGDLSIGDFASTVIGDIVVLDRDNQIANTSTVYVNATGSLELSNDNDTVGELRLRGGTVLTGTGNLGVEGGIYASLPSIVTKDSLIAGQLTLGARGDGPQLIDVAQDVQLNISAQISGVSTATLIKTNRGELYLSNSNLFSGDVELVGGTITVANARALGTTNGVTRANSGIIVLHEVGVGETLNVPGPGAAMLTVDSFGGSWNGPVTLTEDLTVSVPTNRTLSITGQISGPGGWTKNGPGTFTIRSTFTHTYTGINRVLQGRVFLENVFNQVVVPGPLIIGDGNGGANADDVQMLFSNGIGDTAPVTINSSGVLIMGSHDDLIGSLAGSGNVNLGAGNLTVGENDSSTLFSGVISGTGEFEKVGAGTLTLTGNSTYTGASLASEGTLVVNGSIATSSQIQVNRPPIMAGTNNPPGILAGTGFVPTIVPFPGGTVSPGTSPGRLIVQGNANLANSDLRIELNGTTPGTQYDQLRVTGSVNLNNTRLLLFAGFPPTTNDAFVILDKTSAGPITGFFLNTTEGSVMGTGFNKYRITYQGGDGNDVVLRRVEIPGSDISGIAATSPEKMQITGQGVPFVTYILEATPTLNAPLNAPVPWTPIATNTANALGIYEFVDAYADGGINLYPQRFYRVQSP